jgi:hypothetical protein
MLRGEEFVTPGLRFRIRRHDDGVQVFTDLHIPILPPGRCPGQVSSMLQRRGNSRSLAME